MSAPQEEGLLNGLTALLNGLRKSLPGDALGACESGSKQGGRGLTPALHEDPCPPPAGYNEANAWEFSQRRRGVNQRGPWLVQGPAWLRRRVSNPRPGG